MSSGNVREVMRAMLTTNIKHMIGFGVFNSVISGAKIVNPLANN